MNNEIDLTCYTKKKFSKDDYADNFTAFESIKKRFSILYLDLHQEDYGIDVYGYLSESHKKCGKPPIFAIELEVKHNWKGNNFPFEDVHFLAKKQKHINREMMSFWVLCNDDCSQAMIMPMQKILNGSLSVVKCKKGIGDDFFYKIPLSEMYKGINSLERYIIGYAFRNANCVIKQFLS